MGMKDKKKTNRNKKLANQTNLVLVEKDKKLESAEVKKRKRVKESNGDSQKVVRVSVEDNSPKVAKDKKKAKLLRKKKIKSVKNNGALEGKHDQPNAEIDDDFGEINDDGVADQREFEIQGEIGSSEVLVEDGKTKRDKKKRKKDRSSKEGAKLLKKGLEAGQDESRGISSIFKKASNKKKRDLDSSKPKKTLDMEEEADLDDVYLIPSGDEDSSKGMKKWVMEYHESRPGLKVLQQRIDDYISAHEAKLEQERKDKEARAAEGGWTVVKHHKGRKKTSDAESGITVGSSSQAAVEDMVAKKKQSGVGLDFYRFQRKEAQRNEIMMLQSKFEQDKKRIQQLRAARKFKPY